VRWFQRIAPALIVIAAVFAALGAGGCGSGGSSTESSSTVASSTTVAKPAAGPVKAKQLVDGDALASSSVEWPQNGGWVADVGSGRQYRGTLVVTVGGAATSVRHLNGADRNLPRAVRRRINARRLAHPRDGFIEIDSTALVAKHHKTFAQSVHGTGAIRITKAPTGEGLPRSVLNGDIEFTSQSGTTGTLHLKDGTVTLNKDASG
jgi:hypothetical protein